MNPSDPVSPFLPRPRAQEADHAAVAADPERTWAFLRGLDGYEIPLVRSALSLRFLPARLSSLFSRRSSNRAAAATRARIEDIVAPGTGFHLLAEDPGRALVLGAVGSFWQPNIQFAHVTPATFKDFLDPGYAKLTWTLRVDPRAHGGSWVTLDLRADATDEPSWQRFARYWRLVSPLSRAGRRSILAHVRKQLGPAPAGAKAALPGDEFVRIARFSRTHARDIEAPPDQVWPWLVQMGGQRAGWYSLDRFEKGGAPSANRIVPELQHLAVGDLIETRSRGPGQDPLAVLRLEEGRTLVLGSPELRSPFASQEPSTRQGGSPYLSTWTFALEPIGDHASHLVVRVRATYEPSLNMNIKRAATAAVHEVMERAQLRNIKRLVETQA
jgi:hypothetical protein